MVPCDTFVPRAKGTFVSPDGGVAKAIPPYTTTPTSTSRRAKSDFRLMPFPFRTRLRGRERPQGHRSYNGSGFTSATARAQPQEGTPGQKFRQKRGMQRTDKPARTGLRIQLRNR